MKKIAFYVNSTKPSADATRERLSVCAQRFGIDVVDAQSGNPDIVVVLGGDGTMLSAVHKYPGIPLLGLNLGSLGYLASVEEANFDDAIEAIAEGRYGISHRTALNVCGVNALNDVVVSRGASGHAIRMDLSVDGKYATRFVADGLVVATPTGSTAYSMSAGGPIIDPSLDCFCLTPVCAHTLSARPMLLSADCTLEIENICMREDNTYLTVDGSANYKLLLGDTVRIRRSSVETRMIRFHESRFFSVLNSKF